MRLSRFRTTEVSYFVIKPFTLILPRTCGTNQNACYPSTTASIAPNNRCVTSMLILGCLAVLRPLAVLRCFTSQVCSDPRWHNCFKWLIGLEGDLKHIYFHAEVLDASDACNATRAHDRIANSQTACLSCFQHGVSDNHNAVTSGDNHVCFIFCQSGGLVLQKEQPRQRTCLKQMCLK